MPHEPTMTPLMYHLTFLLPSWSRKVSYTVLAMGATEAIETARKAVEREHSRTAVFESAAVDEPRWIQSESKTVDVLSPKALAYYQAADKAEEGRE